MAKRWVEPWSVELEEKLRRISEMLRPAQEEIAAKMQSAGYTLVDDEAEPTSEIGAKARNKAPGSGALPKPAKRPPSDKTRLRAEKFRLLKDAHPEWGYDAVADHARDELKDQNITGETVRYAYGQMDWKWERAGRIR